jgi:hypothetical protein
MCFPTSKYRARHFVKIFCSFFFYVLLFINCTVSFVKTSVLLTHPMAITRLLRRRTLHNTKFLKRVLVITWFQRTVWEDIILNDGPNFFLSDSIVIRIFSYKGDFSHDSNYRFLPELTILMSRVAECFSVCLYTSFYLNLILLSQFGYISLFSLHFSSKVLTFW